MSESKKFGFARDFHNGGAATPFAERRKDPGISHEAHEEALRLAAADSYMRGHGAGIESARLEQTARLALAIEQLTQILQQHGVQLAIMEQQASEESLNFALKFAELLAGSLIARTPIAPIESAARHVFGDLRGHPHIAIRVAPDLVEPVKTSLTSIAREIGLEAKIIVLGEPEIHNSDCRIEWAEGGIITNQNLLETQLRSAIQSALAQSFQTNYISHKDLNQ
jgi:flagellar assembly protein FliH